MNDEFKKLAAKAEMEIRLPKLLNRALFGDFFDIAALREALDILGRRHLMDDTSYRTLSKLHCISWDDMAKSDKKLPWMTKEECFKLLGMSPSLSYDNAIDVYAREIKDPRRLPAPAPLLG